MKLKIATYNIHKGVTAIAGRVRIHEVRAGLQALNADIVFLQEVQDVNHTLEHLSSRHPGGRQTEFLAGGGYPYNVYGMNAQYRSGHHGNAILSRHPIVRWENLDISDHRFEQRGMLHAVASVPASPIAGSTLDETGNAPMHRELHLLCVHFGLFAGSRDRQVKAMIERVHDAVPQDAPLLIAGDFNDWRSRLHAPLIRELNVTEVFASGCPQQRPARTFPSRLPWLRLDRIYVRGCRIKQAMVAEGLGWGRRSDHAPLAADIELMQ